MSAAKGAVAAVYTRMLERPWWVLAGVVALCALAGYYAPRFSFDASAETLVVEGDPDLAAYRRVAETFGGDEFMLMTFTPKQGELFDPANLEHLEALSSVVAGLDGVASVFSVLDAPLLESPRVPLSELAEGYRTLRSSDVDTDLAVSELTSSPLFEELLISGDGRTAAMRVDLALDEALKHARIARDELRHSGADTPEDSARLDRLNEQYRQQRQAYLDRRGALIASLRDIEADFSDVAVIRLGGVPMIAADMIDFVKRDLEVFGTSVIVSIMLVLYAFFRRLRWVLLPMATSTIAILFTVGVLGYMEWPATVISSNFVALLAITTISLTIHLIVRFNELRRIDGDMGIEALLEETMVSKFAPCLYTALTTIAAFGSLTASRIVPVEDFGWMMCIGIALAFVLTFSFFPAALRLMGVGDEVAGSTSSEITAALGNVARWRPWTVTLVAVALAGVAAAGLNRISLDNRFIDYFQDDTEINQGMVYIDQNLGGTIPFDVVVQFAPYEQLTGDDGFVDEFADDFAGGEPDPYPERYWFTRDKLDVVAALHEFVEAREEVGKVVSLTSLERLAATYTDGRKLSTAEVAGVLGLLPSDIREELVQPYASPNTGQLRINARVIESGPYFDRNELVNDIRRFAVDELGLAPDQIRITGMLLLFNSMLLELFDSQVDTLVYVMGATLIMFLVLLRSVLYAVVGLLPNVLAAACVIAFMGYAGISLDMMTTTIAAISIGIGVDDAIHYLHRFREERQKWDDIRVAVAWTHATTGRAMYLTSVTVVLGFSVLVFSNFVPTIMFGLLTALAMALALLANLTVLPSLLIILERVRGGLVARGQREDHG